MRRLIPVFFVMSLCTAFVWSQDESALFDQGMVALSEQNYTVSVDFFEQVVQQNPTFEAYYNLGLAYAGKEDWQQALWAIESAIKLQPTNKDALFNAEYILAKINPNLDWKHPYNWSKRLILAIPLTLWYVIALLSSIVTGLLVLSLITRKYWLGSSSLSFGLGLLFVAGFSLSYSAGVSASNHFTETHYVISIKEQVTTFAGVNGIQLEHRLGPGLRYLFLDEKEDWVKLQFSDEFPVWVAKEQVRIY